MGRSQARLAYRLTILALLLATSSALASNISITANVVYGHKDGMALVYDAFNPPRPNGAAILMIVSGAWVSRWLPPEKRQGWIQHLLDENFTVFVVYHGSGPRFKVPDAVADVRRAVRHIRMYAARFDVDPNRLGVLGGSAGGHLALMLGLTSDSGNESEDDPVLRVSNHLQAVVAYHPPVDLCQLVGVTNEPSALNFDVREAPHVSPINFASVDDPPVLLIHGDQDNRVPLDSSMDMQAALDAVAVVNQIVVIEGAGHGFIKAFHRERAQKETLAFFKKHLSQAQDLTKVPSQNEPLTSSECYKCGRQPHEQIETKITPNSELTGCPNSGADAPESKSTLPRL